MAISKINASNYVKQPTIENNGQSYDRDKKNICTTESKINKFASVPVAVLLTLHPSLLNADSSATKTVEPDISREYVEYMLDGNKAQDYDFELPFNLQEIFHVDVDEFISGHENYTMYYTDFAKTSSCPENAVTGVYLVPESYSLKTLEGEELTAPPRVEGLVLHNLGDKKFYGAIVSEICYDEMTNKQEVIKKEIRLPYQVGEKLQNLVDGKSEFSLSDICDISFEKVFSDEMMQPEVEIQQDIVTFP